MKDYSKYSIEYLRYLWEFECDFLARYEILIRGYDLNES